MTSHRLLQLFRAIAIPGLTALVILVVWEAASRVGWLPHFVLPAPTEIVGELIKSWRILAAHSYVTTLEVFLGFLLALVAGVGLAVAMVYVPLIERAIYPWVVVLQVIPKVALGPLFVIWLGFGLLPKVTIAFLIAFFPILVDTLIGLKSVEQEPVFLLKSMGAGEARIFWYLRLPHALPNIFGGMKVAMTLAIVGAIIGEFVGANEGLGYLLLYANGVMDTRLLFAALVVVSVVALILYAILAALEKATIRWHVSVRMEASRATM
jgi:NitT/TauT family transport system permease protein